MDVSNDRQIYFPFPAACLLVTAVMVSYFVGEAQHNDVKWCVAACGLTLFSYPISQ